MMKKLNYAIGLAVAIAFAAMPQLQAADNAPSGRITFTKDILPILQTNCQTCHRPAGSNLSGMIAPMSLMTYEETRPWAKSIARAVESREMPPWHASPEQHGVFSNERTLTGEQIAAITRWAGSGAPRGRSEDAPEPLVVSNSDGWSIGKPDLVIPFDEAFFVKDEVQDLYQNISVTLTEEQLPADRYIKGLEFRPGSQVVHHIILNATAPGARRGLDRGMLGGMAPGTDPDIYPDGYGKLLKKGSTLVFAMHYHKESGPGTGAYDRSEVAFTFHENDVKPVVIDAIAHRTFEIPPNHPKWKVGSARVFKEDTTILSLMPHMHLRGRAAKYVAFYPDGTEETLLDVPNYDFNWQSSYAFAEPKKIPAGTRIEVSLWFENTPERAAIAGINPDRSVRFGGPTTDEMDLGWLTYYRETE